MTLATSGIPAYAQAGSIVNFANGGYVGDGSGAFTVYTGFTPRWVKIVDVTGVIIYEWFADMPATNSVKTVTGGTTTIDTNSAVVTDNATVTVTEEAVGPPGQEGPGEGTQGTVTVSYDNPTHGTPHCTFGSVVNTSTHVYSWVAQG